MPRWLKSALLLIGTLVVGLAMVEATLRFALPMRNVGPSFTRYDDVYGKRLKADFSATRYSPEFTMTLTTNSLGFRGPKPELPLRDVVLFLGDSFTMGYGVSDGEEFPQLVKAHLPDGAQVLNVGIGDSGNGRWVKFLRREASRYAPSLVVMQVHGNDFYNNATERLFGLTETGELRELPVPPPHGARRLQPLIESIPGLQDLHLLGLARQIHGAMSNAAVATPAANVELTVRLIEVALRLCAGQDWPVVGLLVDVPSTKAAMLAEVFAAFDADVVVIPGADQRPDLYYEIDRHWRPEGHRLAAQLLVERLTARRAVSLRR